MKTFEGYKEVQNLFTHQWDPQDLSCLNHNTPTSCSHRMVLKGFGYYITNLGGGEKNKRGIQTLLAGCSLSYLKIHDPASNCGLGSLTSLHLPKPSGALQLD